MTDEARAARNAYRRQWAKQHPENVKAWQERYWAKKAAQAESQTKEAGEGGDQDATE